MSLLDETIAVAQSGHITDHDRIATKLNEVLDVKADFLATGDGSTDDYTVLNSAVTAAAGGTLFFPPGTYITSNQLSVSTGTRIVLHPLATVKFKSTVSGGKAVFLLDGVDNVTIEGGTLDGNKANNATPTSGLFGIKLLGSTSIRIKDITLQNFPGSDAAGTNGGDGIYMARNAGGTHAAKIWLDRVVCDGNVRTGMAIIDAKKLRVTDCSFTNTTGTNTGAGVDIEPNSAANDVIEDVTFTACHFVSNNIGADIANGQQAIVRRVTFRDCTVITNTKQGYSLNVQSTSSITTNRSVKIFGGETSGNGEEGIVVSNAKGYGAVVIGDVDVFQNGEEGIQLDACRFFEIRGCTIAQNGKHGIAISRSVNSGGHLAHVHHNRIFNNGTDTTNTYDGLNISSSVAGQSGKMLVSENFFGNDAAFSASSEQRYGWAVADTNTDNITFINNYYVGNATGTWSTANATGVIVIERGTGAADNYVLGPIPGTDTATNAARGFIYIPTTNGTPTGTPANPASGAGQVPFIFDRSNNKLWVYDGGWIGVVLA